MGTPLDAANKSNNIQTANVLKEYGAEEQSFFNFIWQYVELAIESYDAVTEIGAAAEAKQE